MRDNGLFEKISNEEYEEVRKAGKVLCDFLKKHRDALYDEIVVTNYGSIILREESIESINVSRTREEEHEQVKKILKEWEEECNGRKAEVGCPVAADKS